MPPMAQSGDYSNLRDLLEVARMYDGLDEAKKEAVDAFGPFIPTSTDDLEQAIMYASALLL